MATRISAGLSVSEGRRFGVTVGAAFAVLGAVAWWRDHLTVARVAMGVGAVLMSLGLVVPTLLGPVRQAWMGLAVVMSKVTTPIALGVIWFVVVTPTAIVRRLLGRTALEPRLSAGSYWVSRSTDAHRRAGMERQF